MGRKRVQGMTEFFAEEYQGIEYVFTVTRIPTATTDNPFLEKWLRKLSASYVI